MSGSGRRRGRVVIGVDFTSAPRARKPLTVAVGRLVEGPRPAIYHLDAIRELATLAAFDDLLREPGDWLGGFDLPFGQPRTLIEHEGWPTDWREFVRFYCMAIVFAGIAWVVGESFGGQGGKLVGASGGVMAVLAAFIWHFPRQTVLVYGVFPVPVWALGVLYLVSDVQGAAQGSGNVAHLAHLGGAVFGLLYAWRGWSLEGLAQLPQRFFKRQPRMRIVRPDDDQRTSARPGDDPRLDEAVDRILEKISRTGESSLTAAERETLPHASRRLKERSRS